MALNAVFHLYQTSKKLAKFVNVYPSLFLNLSSHLVNVPTSTFLSVRKQVYQKFLKIDLSFLSPFC